jgi:hypothetical protein
MTLLEILIGLAIGFLSGYLISYFKEKGKNKALLSDIKILTDEKERIVSDYKLDIEKRKYKYESKKEQYFKYFNLIDEFGKSSNNDIYEQFFPIVDKFNKEFLSAENDKNKELEAINTFSTNLNPIVAKSNENLVRLRAETHSIRLIANSKVLGLLNQIDKLYDISLDKSTLMLREMGTNIISGNSDVINSQRQEVESLGLEIKTLHEELVFEIRQELDEI